mgnify:CR=1 FL=1
MAVEGGTHRPAGLQPEHCQQPLPGATGAAPPAAASAHVHVAEAPSVLPPVAAIAELASVAVALALAALATAALSLAFAALAALQTVPAASAAQQSLAASTPALALAFA